MVRFSLATLLVLMLFVAIGCAALVNANDTWRQAIVTLTVITLTVSTLVAVVRRDKFGLTARGFAVAGWIYLILALVPAVGLRNELLTDKALVWLVGRIHGQRAPEQTWPGELEFSSEGTLIGLVNISTVQTWEANTAQRNDFYIIGHALWAIVLACLGGIVARLVGGVTNRDKEAS